MAQINVNDLTFNYEGSFDNIFEHVSFSIDTDWKLGFIGRNGKGKTTFLRLLLGKLEYKGSISKSTCFSYFPYSIAREQEKLMAVEIFLKLMPDFELWKVIRELEKMNMEADLLYRPYETLSFGERTKIMLALLFSKEGDFLLIDEPTNHLDQDARQTVKEYLMGKKGFILVSHDRDLLDACVDHVLVLNRQTIEVQKGNFSTWWENKNRADAFAIMENEKHKKEISKLKEAARRVEKWADKSEHSKIGFDPIKEHERNISTRSYIGAKTKKMQSRVKDMEGRINKEISEKEGLLQDIENVTELKLFPMKHHKEVLAFSKEYGLKYKDANDFVFEDLSFSLCQGDRLCVAGKNGCGKSSLIKAILSHSINGNEDSDNMKFEEKGIIETASGMIISYINQNTSFLKGSIFDFCKNRNLDEKLLCAILRQLDVDRIQFEKNMEEFSEGQKKKVLIASSLLTSAHLYIWDEPLNYIDVFSRMQIEKLILNSKPTMLIVEHDVRFCDKIATKDIFIKK